MFTYLLCIIATGFVALGDRAFHKFLDWLSNSKEEEGNKNE